MLFAIMAVRSPSCLGKSKDLNNIKGVQVMKKIATILSLVLVICMMAVLLASCGETPEIKIGENGNWFINGEDTGVKAEGKDGTSLTDKYIVDVKTAAGIDEYGLSYTETTVTYNDGTTKSEKTYVSTVVEEIWLESLDTYYTGFAPMLTLCVQYTNGSYDYLPVTENMLVTPLPDFTTPGEYPLHIAYGGHYTQVVLEVVDGTGIEVDYFYISNDAVRVGTPLSEVGLHVQFTDGEENDRGSYTVPLTACSAISVSAFDKVGDINVNLTYKGVSDNTYVEVYDPAVSNIRYAWLNDSVDETLPLNADAAAIQALVTSLVGKEANVYLFEYAPRIGTDMLTIKVTADMIDVSKIDTSAVGVQFLYINYTVEGQGTYQEEIAISVEADLTSATLLGSYGADPAAPMLDDMFGAIALYNNGVATYGNGMAQASYTLSGTTLTLSMRGSMIYLALDTTNHTYNIFQPTGTPTNTYANPGENLKVEVYADYVVISYYMPAEGTNPEMKMPVCTMSASAIENNKLDFMGMGITLNQDGTCTFD